jgi:hypothetical protein
MGSLIADPDWLDDCIAARLAEYTERVQMREGEAQLKKPSGTIAGKRSCLNGSDKAGA